VERIRHKHTDEITTCVSDVRKKDNPGCQSKETHPTSMRLQCELISNGLYSPLPIWQRSITDLSSPLLIGLLSVTDFTSPLSIGLTFVTGSFNIRYVTGV
jgi:hypothetical protein